jgi:hypothetical protein
LRQCSSRFISDISSKTTLSRMKMHRSVLPSLFMGIIIVSMVDLYFFADLDG